MPANLRLPTVSVAAAHSTLSSVFSPTRVSPAYLSFNLSVDAAEPRARPPLASPETDSDDGNDSDSYIGAAITPLFGTDSAQSLIVRDQAARRSIKPLKIVISQRKASSLSLSHIGSAIHKHPNAIPGFDVAVHHAHAHLHSHAGRADTLAPYHHVPTPHPSPRHLDGEKTPVQLTPGTARPMHGASATVKRCAGH